MLESTILVISEDTSFIDTVRGVVRSIEELNLAVLPGFSAADSYDAWDGVALVVIHLKRRGPAPEVARLLRTISEARRPVATLVFAQEYDTDQALTLIRQGVADCLNWPLDVSRLSYLIEVLTVRARHTIPMEFTEKPRLSFADAVSVPDPVLDDLPNETDLLMDQVRRVAPQSTTILLGGETGTGKTRLAHMIHEMSPRRSEPFLVINCGSLSAGLIESELFGHVRGAFPGADRDRPGKFAEVGRGTLFLDEIDSLPMVVQTKLLRVVEDRVFEPVGSDRAQPVRARLIAASNRPLDEEVEAHRFRSDLYFRLNVIGLQLPPLRTRRGAIPSLVAKFIAEFAARNGRKVSGITEDALQILEAYAWPGNIRELRNVIERAVALSSVQEIHLEDLPPAIRRAEAPAIIRPDVSSPVLRPLTAAGPVMARTTLAQIKREAELTRITEALEKHGNNRLRTASELGISRMTLYKKLYKYGLMQPAEASHDGVA